jgi:alpha-N-arabinofuranosidase
MRFRLLALSCLASLLPVVTVSGSAQITETRPMPPVVDIQVNPDGNIGTVWPRLFGTFIEPIDNSIDNGVVAEILVNGSLEAGLWNHAMLEQIFRDQPELIESTTSTGIPIPWQSLNPAAGNRFELHVRDAANSWQSLEIMGTPDQLTGIKQRICLPVPREYTYTASLYAKHLSGPAQLSISIRSLIDGKVLASSEIDASSGEWRKYTTTLHLQPGSVRRLEPVDFAVAVEGDERVDVDQVSLMPDDAVGTFDPDVLHMAADMGMTELRLGGNFSSYYHWKDGIGPLDQRVTMQNISWGIPEYNNFGTDEFLKFCELVRAEPQFDLNMGSGSPEEAAEWVKYVRDRYKGPLILEMGNELYGKWQVGYPTLKEIAPRTLAFSKAIHSVAPDALFMATGQTPFGFTAWNGAQLTNPPGTFDLLTTHFIIGTNHVRLGSYTPDFMAAAAYAVPYAVASNLDSMQSQVNEAKGYQNTHFAVTEWLFNSKGQGERNFTNESPSSRNVGGAVMIASTFNTYFRHSNQVRLVDMTGLMEFAGIWKRREQVFTSPAYYIFQMYARSKGDTVLPVTTNSGTYSVRNGTVGFPDVDNVPYIDVAATLSQDKKMLTLFCVNRSLTLDTPVRISLGKYEPGRTISIEQIYDVSRYVINDEVEPKRVVPRISSITLPPGQPVEITLPHEGVTVLRIAGQ